MLVRPLLWPRPLLAPYIAELLRNSLPGIDPNDIPKTSATLGFYSAFLGSVPLVDATSADEDAAAVPDSPQRAWSLEVGAADDPHAGEAVTLDDDERSLYQAAWSSSSEVSE